MLENNHIVIMAGGAGTRFWPASTEAKPKQFLDILGIGKSLLRLTFERALKLTKPENIIILTNRNYQHLVSSDCPELPLANILCEPSRNNTAPAIAWAALHIDAIASNSTFAVLPSDHIIIKEDKYIEILQIAFLSASKSNAIITLGIDPTRPDTGYGYIKYQESEEVVKKVEKFVEKPNLNTALEYLRDGHYLWNAGMFVWKTTTILNLFREYSPRIINVLQEECDVFGTNREQEYIDRVFPLTENISIDYAILEKADCVYTIPADIGWSDLGTWASLYDYKNTDAQNSVLIGNQIVTEDVDKLMVYSSTGKKILVRGLHNFIVVDDHEGLLIYPMDKEQELKKSLEKLKHANDLKNK